MRNLNISTSYLNISTKQHLNIISQHLTITTSHHHNMAPYIIALLTALLVVLFVLEWRHQRRLSTRVHLMREALRNRDFMFRLPTDSIMPGERELQKMLNEMGGEINQLMARSEVESWQRLTRVLTHEIMNLSLIHI